jgi:phage repressor protein C with HTH and peptisase S24 domain
MLRDILDRIERRLAIVGTTAAEASRGAGLSPDAIRNIQRTVEGGKSDAGVSSNTLVKLAPILGCTPGWLLTGVGEEEAHTLLIGRAAATPDGSILFATGDPTGYTVPALPWAPDAVALELSGPSMGDIYPDGSIVYFRRQHTAPTAELFGTIVAVETEEDRVLVKYLHPDAGDTFMLSSVVGEPLRNQRVRWVAPIITALRPPFSRTVIRHSTEVQTA